MSTELRDRLAERVRIVALASGVLDGFGDDRYAKLGDWTDADVVRHVGEDGASPATYARLTGDADDPARLIAHVPARADFASRFRGCNAVPIVFLPTAPGSGPALVHVMRPGWENIPD